MIDFKLFRKKNKLTQIQAAEYFGCTQAFISLIERGESKLPKEYISKIKADPNFDSSMLNEEFQQNNNDEKLIENIAIPVSVWKKMEQLIDTVTSQQKTIEILSLKVKNEDVPRDDGVTHATASGFSEK